MTDVDEFPVVRVNDGTLRGLLETLDYPDAISLNEALYSTGGQVTFDTRLVTESFTRRLTMAPHDEKRARRGLKTIARNKPDVLKIRNHRPVTAPHHAQTLRWLDGSEQDFPMEFRHVHEKGIDCRGRTELAYVNHYTVRSVESFLVKLARGDAVAPWRTNLRYFRRHNQNGEENTEIFAMLPRLKEEIARLMMDSELADLHHASVVAHRAKIRAIKQSPDFAKALQALNVAPEPDIAKAA